MVLQGQFLHLLGAVQAVLRPVDDDDALGAPHEGAVHREDADCKPNFAAESHSIGRLQAHRSEGCQQQQAHMSCTLV